MFFIFFLNILISSTIFISAGREFYNRELLRANILRPYLSSESKSFNKSDDDFVKLKAILRRNKGVFVDKK